MPAKLDAKFEKFLGGPNLPAQQRLYATLSDRNVIILGNGCLKGLGSPTSVYLHFNRADEVIAVEAVEGYEQAAAFPLKPMATGKYINAAPFCRHYGIRLARTARFISPEFRDGALHLKLRETVAVARRRLYKRRPTQATGRATARDR